MSLFGVEAHGSLEYAIVLVRRELHTEHTVVSLALFLHQMLSILEHVEHSSFMTLEISNMEVTDRLGRHRLFVISCLH